MSPPARCTHAPRAAGLTRSCAGVLPDRVPHQRLGAEPEQVVLRVGACAARCCLLLPELTVRVGARAPRRQSLAGPWSAQQDIAPSATRTWYSQNAFDLPLGANAIYMGDRWRPDLLGSSRYVWYPLDFSSGAPQIVHADVWSVDVQAGA